MTYKELWQCLTKVYHEGEAKAIARMAYEERYGLTLSDIYLGKDTQLPVDGQAEMQEIAKRLLKGEPIQYVLGQADFCGRTFLVDRHVLIPRPETEELCRWIISEVRGWQLEKGDCPILDIGTGSGCIATTLAAELPQAQLTAWDVSAEALDVACENAERNHVSVRFEQVDVLNIPYTSSLTSQYSLIVSNPPYICNEEREMMEANVLDYEPHTALFVPDDDPLLFYRTIVRYGQSTLKDGGWLYFEINPLYAESLRDMLCAMRYFSIEIKTDQYGKQRMMRAQKSEK